jgi:hypothetical protein
MNRHEVRAMTPAEREARIERNSANIKAWLARDFPPCPYCGVQQAGPIHRKSEDLWRGRAGRARENEGIDPVSGVTLEDAECHLAGIFAGEGATP